MGQREGSGILYNKTCWNLPAWVLVLFPAQWGEENPSVNPQGGEGVIPASLSGRKFPNFGFFLERPQFESREETILTVQRSLAKGIDRESLIHSDGRRESLKPCIWIYRSVLLSRMTAEAKSLEAEDEDFAPRPSWGRRTCSGRRLILVLLGVLGCLLLAMVVFGFSGRKLNADLSGMQGNLKSINQSLFSELASLKEKGASEAKLVAKINAMAKNLTEEVKEAKTQFRDQISKLQSAVLTMNCELEDAKHNRTGTSKRICCPKGWFPFARNCYWFSNSEKTWEEAKLDCENKEAHLAIITTYQEKMFVVQHTKPHNFWIGLSFVNRTWKWVDGTAYAMRRIDWRPQEPNNFSFLVPMESADCVHIYRDGLWSDEHCQYRYNWVCEMEAKG